MPDVAGLSCQDVSVDEPQPLVEVRNATVRYGTLAALDGVDFRMFPGEVHSLLGENGAGKSTLIKALTGAIRLDQGTITLGGVEAQMASPYDARRLGIGTVYQEVDLLTNLSVAENVWLGREPRRWGMIDTASMRASAASILADLGLDIDPASPLGRHSLAAQQLVAIARAIAVDMRVLILDEPTSSLDLDEVAELFRVIRELKDRGVAILFVSHFLEQVYELCDRITVLRDGRLVGEYLTTQVLRIDLVNKMLGKDGADFAQRERPADALVPESAYLSARGIASKRRIAQADVDVAAGEVLGLAGLLGSGRTELARALTGIDRPRAGVITIEGRTESLDSPHRALQLGVVYSSENRRVEGLIEDQTVLENIVLAVQAQEGALRPISPARRRELAMSWIEALDIRPANPDAKVSTLSGGNQQKVMLARLLALSPRVIVLDEPTRGVDVGAKVEIQNLVGELADNGLSVVYISVELEEVLRVGDRVAVVRDGRIAQTVAASELNPDSLLALVAQPDVDDEPVWPGAEREAGASTGSGQDFDAENQPGGGR